MNTICLCEEHKKMIADASLEDLQKMSTDQLTIVEQTSALLDGFNNPNWPEMEALALLDGHEKIADTFKYYRDNAQKIFEIAQEEIKKRLSTNDVKCLIPGVQGYATQIHANGTVTRIREKDL